MKIAVQAADLDAERIDGTRIYLLRLLERFGSIAPRDDWHLFHRKPFHAALAPPAQENYTVHTAPFPFFWTQTRFSFELFRLAPERLFMPVQALPLALPSRIESIVTIHDLAFKIFPEYFPPRDRRRLNWFTDFAVRKASRLIAVSHSTKRDILRFYKDIPETKIRVIHHGFDAVNSREPSHGAESDHMFLNRFSLSSNNFLLAVGAIQPRKNLLRLLKAFESCAREFPDMKLALAGESAWMSQPVFEAFKRHPFQNRIVLTGRVSFREREILYKNARIFVFPSLYEGFGLPILEAFSAGTPVISADNSSLPEVAGNAALFFDAKQFESLVDAIRSLWENTEKQKNLIDQGRKRLRRFSWDRCAQETARYILGS